MDVRNRLVTRLRCDNPLMSKESIKAAADKAAEDYLKKEKRMNEVKATKATSGRSRAWQTGNTCTGMEVDPTEVAMCDAGATLPTCDSNERYSTVHSICSTLRIDMSTVHVVHSIVNECADLVTAINDH